MGKQQTLFPDDAPAPHYCHALLCERIVHPRMLMCPQHWNLVPRDLQRRVWDAYVPGQEVKKNPTRRYLNAMQAAINAVARTGQ